MEKGISGGVVAHYLHIAVCGVIGEDRARGAGIGILADPELLDEEKVDAILEIHDGILAAECCGTLEDETIGFGSAPENVASQLTDEDVLARIATQGVVAVAAKDSVVVVAAAQLIVPPSPG